MSIYRPLLQEYRLQSANELLHLPVLQPDLSLSIETDFQFLSLNTLSASPQQ